jgi:hypothetical protein
MSFCLSAFEPFFLRICLEIETENFDYMII